MASYNRIVFGGSSDTISVPFAYLDKTHVQVYLNGILQASSAYTWPSNGQVKITAGNPASGTVGEVRRVTPSTALVSFSPGNLDTNDLNVAATQSLLIAEEAKDLFADSGPRSWVTAGFQPGGSITKGGAGEVAIFDADGNMVPGPDAGEISAAQSYAAAAQSSKQAADASATDSSGSADLAQKWASNPEDTEVTPGLFSAFHWYRKALAVYNVISNQLAGWIHGAALKTFPSGADEMPISDSGAGWGLKKLTFSALIEWLHTVFGPSYLKGLITSKSSAFVVSVAAGEIKGNGLRVVNAGAFTKNLNAVWAAGAGNGGRLEAAALTANTTYHLHALRKDSDGSFDWGFSTSATAPTIPAGYSWVGRFDWCYSNAGLTAIVDYNQVGNVKYMVATNWFVSTTGNISEGLYIIPSASPVPAGIRTELTTIFDGVAGASGSCSLYACDGDAVGSVDGPVRLLASNSARLGGGAKLKTTLARQLRLRIDFSGSGSAVSGFVSNVDDYTLNRIY